MAIKKALALFFLTISFYGYSTDTYTQKYNNSCTAYTDVFGPLKTGYTMGDALRYSVTKDLNVFSPSNSKANYVTSIIPPAGAGVIFNYGKNTGNLYNALGYLYAGWLALNNPAYKYVEQHGGCGRIYDKYIPKEIQENHKNRFLFHDTKAHWLSYRNTNPQDGVSTNQQDGLTDFDNNKNQGSLIYLPLNIGGKQIIPALFDCHGSDTIHPLTTVLLVNPGDSYTGTNYNKNYGQDSFTNRIQTIHHHPDWASQSGWCSNGNAGNWVYVFQPGLINSAWQGVVLVPTIQFFGARIAHILGAIVNDIPWSDDNSSSGAVGAKGATASPSPAFTSPLISGSAGTGTALPMFAVMSGGPYSTAADVPKDMIQPSTAHYGSINTFLSKLSDDGTDNYNYLQYHLKPTVSRLSQLFSYGISNNKNSLNLIKINDTNVTSMDQGVIACIKNNTGVGLLVKQITAGGVAQEIGELDSFSNNFYLNTASLVSSSSAANSSSSSSSDGSTTSGTLSTATNMIIIEDAQDTGALRDTTYSDLKLAVYIQVLQAADMINLVTAFNALQSGGYSYNQTQSTPKSFSNNYLVVTNFDPTINSDKLVNVSTDSNVLDSYRIQIIDIDQFLKKPYYLTIQINKENLSYGLLTPENTGNKISNSELNAGVKNAPFLYPSFSSVKTFTWQSICDAKEGTTGFSKIPLLMIPSAVYSYNPGVLIYYVIWTVAYAAALTEFSYNGVAFGDTENLHANVFGLFSQDTKAVDLTNVKSGYSSKTYKTIVDAQGELVLGSSLDLAYFSILSSATLDVGGNFHQDISILNLVNIGIDKFGNNVVSVNDETSEYVNLSATIGTLKTTIPAKFRDLYQNVLLFSIPMQALKDGININVKKTQPELTIVDSDGQTTTSSSVGYELIITSTKDFTDSSNVLYKAGSVLVDQKVTLDPDLYDFGNTTFDFLYKEGDTSWTSPQQITDRTSGFSLKYSSAQNKNTLSIAGMIDSKGKAANFNIIDYFNPYSIDRAEKGISSFNFNTTNTGYGFSFIKNPWDASTGCSADIASVFGLTDFKIAMIGVDSKNNFVLNVADKSKIDHFVVYLFDKKNNQVGDIITIPLDVDHVYDNGTIYDRPKTKASIVDTIQSSFAFGLNSKAQSGSYNYPFIIEFKNVKPFGFANSYSVDLKNQSLSSFNFNTNSLGFSFIKNPWSTTTELPVSADIVSAIAGKTDFKWMIMGADKNNLPVLNISKNNNVDHLNLYLYDKENKLIQEPIAIPFDGNHVYNFNTKTTAGITKSIVVDDIGPYFNLAVNGKPGVSLNYPFIVEFTNIKPLKVAPKSIKPKATPKATSKVTPKPQPKAKITPPVPAEQSSSSTSTNASSKVSPKAASTTTTDPKTTKSSTTPAAATTSNSAAVSGDTVSVGTGKDKNSSAIKKAKDKKSPKKKKSKNNQ